MFLTDIQVCLFRPHVFTARLPQGRKLADKAADQAKDAGKQASELAESPKKSVSDAADRVGILCTAAWFAAPSLTISASNLQLNLLSMLAQSQLLCMSS